MSKKLSKLRHSRKNQDMDDMSIPYHFFDVKKLTKFVCFSQELQHSILIKSIVSIYQFQLIINEI